MGSPTEITSQKMKTAIIFQLTFICLITAQGIPSIEDSAINEVNDLLGSLDLGQTTTQSQDGDYCCQVKTVGDQSYYFIRVDDVAYSYGCKSNCIYKKVYSVYGGYGDDGEYCFRNGYYQTTCDLPAPES